MEFKLPDWVARVLSVPRFGAYLDATNRDVEGAWELYRWNVEVSEAFYGPLHCIEIALRNTEHRLLRTRYGRPDWWNVAPLTKHDASRVDKAYADLDRKGVPSPTPDDVVAELGFGFWVSLLNRTYDRHLWVPALHRAFPHYHGRRKSLHDALLSMVLFRNRIMHHEPIHHRDLAADHRKIYRLLSYMEPAVTSWLCDFDRVPDVLKRRPGGGRR
ncbi:hypothetical protein [Microbispora sp. H10885]|uniref:hypothetical protein n=1 Tax=Microbispora sp. H10885 TaxID=2729110 RepID=UPI001603EFF3|nr:hypothetical protein [Microbispora sp. H10885]